MTASGASFAFFTACAYFFGLCVHALPHCAQLPVQLPPQQPPFFIVRRQTRDRAPPRHDRQQDIVRQMHHTSPAIAYAAHATIHATVH